MWVAFRSFVTIVCSQPSPQLRAKFAGILRQHMANAHNVGVVWFNCEVEGCNYRAKVKGRLICGRQLRKRDSLKKHIIRRTTASCVIYGCRLRNATDWRQ